MISDSSTTRKKLRIAKLKAKHLKDTVHHSLRDSIASTPPEIRKVARNFLLGSLLLFILISAGKFYLIKKDEIEREKEIAAGPIVRTTEVVESSGEHETTVIGETRPYQSVTLYAKVSGYLKKMNVDKGDSVKQGQILSFIESPETDQAFAAAKANAKNKHDIAVRMSSLLKQELVSQQEAEQALSDDAVADAQYRSQEVLKGYETIRAPFAGTVTARYADPGALVQNATNSQSSALPLVTVSQVERLRVDIFIDQRDAPFVEKNQPVIITLPERADLKILGKVNRRSDQLDPRTKMMLIEVDIPNEDKHLVAGSFVQVSLNVKSIPSLEAPVEAMVLKDNKTCLSVVTPDNHLTYRPVTIAVNNGKQLWISTGVKKGERVALNTGDSIPEGGLVRPMAIPMPSSAPAKKGP